MSKVTGGPAFPTLAVVGDVAASEGGTTIRDYFAAKAMQGFAADPNYDATLEEMAEWSYKWADAMLAEREKGNSK